MVNKKWLRVTDFGFLMQGVPTPGNMASNLDMVNDMVLEDESTEAGIEGPDETWERLLT